MFKACDYFREKRFTFKRQILYTKTTHVRAILCINAAIYFCVIYTYTQRWKGKQTIIIKGKYVHKYANYYIAFVYLAMAYSLNHHYTGRSLFSFCHLKGNWYRGG